MEKEHGAYSKLHSLLQSVISLIVGKGCGARGIQLQQISPVVDYRQW